MNKAVSHGDMQSSVFTRATKPDVLPGIKGTVCLWNTAISSAVFLGQGNFTILKMLMSPEVSKEDSKINYSLVVLACVYLMKTSSWLKGGVIILY